MEWYKPKDEHIIYEALSAIADNRLELLDETHAKCFSSTKGKYYEIEYEADTKSIMSNDNKAYFRGEVSYPMVAMLLAKNVVNYDKSILEYFRGIVWKNINQRNKNDYMKSVEQFLSDLQAKGIDVDRIKSECLRIYEYICNLKLQHFGKRKFPPKENTIQKKESESNLSLW